MIKIARFIFITLILSNCISVYENPKFTNNIKFNLPRLEPVLFRLKTNFFDLYGNKKELNENAVNYYKMELIKEINNCRCLTSFIVISDLEKIEDFSEKYNYIVELEQDIFIEHNIIALNEILTFYTLGIIPTWNNIKYKLNYKLLKKDNTKLLSNTYENKVKLYRHFILLARMPFDKTSYVFDKADIVKKIIYDDIYCSNLIPLAN
ncbi:hypothetical protein LPTSP3_g00820 [Leptospira kobayashii]|uniref:Lipoprotein n=1 Tax=Leptospira kobayashii TaxID=1917830 RepID=A0ABN6K868_9LEPT|nr:hypothetical protein [Leptospira kobayashii]BDA77152.1 hypothetical protein LPTSP3_g00820 [Leptospira kobayashii]